MSTSTTIPERVEASLRNEDTFYNRFALFWHVVTYGQLAVAAYWQMSVASQSGEGLSVRLSSVLALLIVQGLLYWRSFIAGGWPPPARRLWTHFVVGLGICLAYYWLAPPLTFLALQYVGHTFGSMLPITRALPIIAAATIIAFSTLHLWHFGYLSRGGWLAILGPIVGASVSYWFLRRSVSFSDQQRELLRQLRQANQDLEAARARERELAALHERERLARDMHDTLGHALVALSVQLEATQRLYRVDPARASLQMDALKTLTRDSVAMLRRTISGLRTPELGNRPLDIALQQLAVEAGQQSGIAVRCAIDGTAATMIDGELAEAVWFIAKEALMNVQKHARATAVAVTLRTDLTHITLTVDDNGAGMPPDAESKPGHFGLKGIRERVVAHNGQLTITKGDDGNGTRIAIRLPRPG